MGKGLTVQQQINAGNRGGSAMPIFYNYANVDTSLITPSTVHVAGSAIAKFFKRYLLQRAISVYKWTMPDWWMDNYALYTLYCTGYYAIIATDRYGVIPQHCGLKGYGVQYEPTNAVISNPLLRGLLEPRIDKECVLMRLCPDYGGINDVIDYFGNLEALAAECQHLNIFNSRLSYVIMTDSNSAAQSFYKLFDTISKGNPCVAGDKRLLKDDGTPLWQAFEQNVGQNFIADKLADVIRTAINDFDTYIGINNSNTQKKERLITDEVNANNQETQTMADMWLEELKKCCDKARAMFGIDISVDWRYNTEEVMSNADSDNERPGSVQL